jgi:hypothetical protein
VESKKTFPTLNFHKEGYGPPDWQIVQTHELSKWTNGSYLIANMEWIEVVGVTPGAKAS